MLRVLALALLLANAAYLAWGQGLLAAYGWAPARQAEPERLARQIRPEALQLVMPPTAQPLPAKQPQGNASAALTPPPTSRCLQVGVFTEQQARALRPHLQSRLPAGGWSFESGDNAARWIVYMGKYVSKDAMDRKRAMLRQLELPFEPPASPLLNPGLSLGSFASKTEAEEALAQMALRGLRSARVVLERPELPSLWLRLPAADAAVQARLEGLGPPLAGKAVQACT